MEIGYIGLGKMGLNMVKRMISKGHSVSVYNRSKEPLDQANKYGAKTYDSIPELINNLSSPKTIWIMVSWQAVPEIIDQILPLLSRGDTIIDGGNSPYIESVKRSKKITKKGINFLDVGVSGGPNGALNGACLMIGGEKSVYEKYQTLFSDLSVENGYLHVGPYGAGHFVKMVHNGIEYGMMQAIGEGFAVLKKSDFNLDLRKIANLYNNGSVIESRLIGWLKSSYDKHTQDLVGISGSVKHSGEGEWTVKAAKKMGIKTEIIKKSLDFRVKSEKDPSYTGQVVSALRNEFGGHDVSVK